jgi:hydrogenase maturation protease
MTAAARIGVQARRSPLVPCRTRLETLVVALGNDLAGDDAVGPHALRVLASRRPPEHLRLANAGTDALRIADLWNGEPRVWLVDAVCGSAPPGTVHDIHHDALFGTSYRAIGAHLLSLPDLLGWMLVAHPDLQSVRFHLWGIEACSFRPGRPPDPRVRAGIRRLVERMLDAARDDPENRD